MDIFQNKKIRSLRNLLEYMRKQPYIKNIREIDIEIEQNEEMPYQKKIDKLRGQIEDINKVINAFKLIFKTLDSKDLEITEHIIRGLSQSEIAKLKGCSSSKISKIEGEIFVKFKKGMISIIEEE